MVDGANPFRNNPTAHPLATLCSICRRALISHVGHQLSQNTEGRSGGPPLILRIAQGADLGPA